MTGATLPKIRLPYPHQGQRTVRTQAKRFNFLSAGRRWRKTTLAMALCVEAAAHHKQVIWGSPTYDQTYIAWEEAQRAAHGVARFNQSRMTARFPSGGQVLFKSFDNPDNARGHTADGVVIDEAADVDGQAWPEVLRPMLIDTGGWAWIVGTPKGRNWFWQGHVAALDAPDHIAWQAPTLGVEIAANGLIRKPHALENPEIQFEEIEHLYATLSERAFRQEILAEFVEDGGGVFRGVRSSATASADAQPESDHDYVIGCDWGRSNDYTVFCVMDLTVSRMVELQRSNQVEYAIQRGRLNALCEKWKPVLVIAEENAMGAPIIEQLARDGLPIKPFTTTNATKAAAIDALALAFERGNIAILNNPILIAELEAFESTRLPSGLTRYSAPDGLHDDCVIALALAWQGCIAGGMGRAY